MDEVKGQLDIKPDLPLELFTRLGLALDCLFQRHRIMINRDVKKWWLNYRILVKLGEPEFVLKEGNELDIPGLTIKLDIDAKLQLLTHASDEKGKRRDNNWRIIHGEGP